MITKAKAFPIKVNIRIFSYLSYTEYLKTCLDQLKVQAKISLRAWSQELKMTPAYLSMIINKKRPLTISQAKKISRSLAHSSEEKDYFELLIRFQNEATPSKREEYFKILSTNRLFIQYRPRDQILSRYLSSPIHVLLREALELEDCTFTTDWIKERLWFQTNKSELSKAIRFLTENEFIGEDENKRLKQMDFQLNCSAEALRSSMGRFHRDMFKITADAIQKVPREQRNIQSHVASLSERQFNDVKRVIDDAVKKIEEITAKEDIKKEVYYIGLQLIPLTSKRTTI